MTVVLKMIPQKNEYKEDATFQNNNHDADHTFQK